jgi:hypothetical protein
MIIQYDVDVPKRIRAPLDSEKINTSIQKKILHFKRSLIKAISVETRTDATSIVYFEYKTFERTDNTVEEIRCCDRVIGLVYFSRTDFNHQEVLFAQFLDGAMSYIKKEVRNLKKLIK